MSRVVNEWLLALAKPGYSSTNFPPKKLKLYQLNELIESADWHGVLPCVVNNLYKSAKESSWHWIVNCKESSKELEIITNRALSNFRKRAALKMLLTLQEKQIVEEFKRREIPYIIIKGTQFATRLYETETLRLSSDVDILVPMRVLTDVTEAMLSLDYDTENNQMKYSGDYGQEGWQWKKQPGCRVEVHWNLVNSPTIRRGVSITYEKLQLDDDGQASPASILLIAVVHAATSHCFDRLCPLVDILQAVRGMAGEIDEYWLRDALKQTGATRSLSVALYLVEKLFNEPLCGEFRRRLGIDCTFLEKIILTPGVVLRRHCDVDSFRRSVFRELLKKG